MPAAMRRTAIGRMEEHRGWRVSTQGQDGTQELRAPGGASPVRTDPAARRPEATRKDRGWWRRAVFYQIYPRSFADSDGDGIGDLRGIIGRLDHLRGAPHSLGVDAVWLSPFYRSPMADFGYDISDHTAVDPLFGTLADAEELIGQAHERGLRVILDLVPNHTSDQNAWFVEARSSRDSKHRDWYV